MAKISNWDKFTLLLWKNWVQYSRKRIIITSILISLLSLVCSLILTGIRLASVERLIPEAHYPEQDISNLKLLGSIAEVLPKFILLYSPNTSNIYDSIVKDAANSLKLSEYHGYANARDLEQALAADNYLAGVQFDESAEYPNKLAYALRFPSKLRTPPLSIFDDEVLTWSTDKLFPKIPSFGPREREDDDGGVPVGYLREGFLPIQQAISMAHLKLAGKQVSLPEIVMQRYPFPESSDIEMKSLTKRIDYFISMIMMTIFMHVGIYVSYSITMEKRKQLKELMKIVGLRNWLHWIAWFVTSFIIMSVPGIVITICLKITWRTRLSALTYSNITVVYFFVNIYIITSICFYFMIVAFFNHPGKAAAVTAFTWLLSYFPYLFLSSNQMHLGQELCWSLLVNSAMGFGFKVISAFEIVGEGLRWSNLFTPPSADEDLTVGAVMLLMLISCVIYLLICLYVEEVLPRDLGVAKKWYFPFTKDFWFPTKHHVAMINIADTERRYPDAFETEPVGKHVGVQVRNLEKHFGEKIAVHDLSINMYQDEITVLLGHNGAGKTTTISMLVGLIPSSSGTAFVNGYDIRTNMDNARDSLGICTQHDILFDDMTVANHIIFFSRLKGMKEHSVKKEVQKYLGLLNLRDKADLPSSKLSGGMKRKLSLGCAICGEAKVVLCDEPSAGLDPSARRQLWSLLQAEKTGRTILLTTHLMDEADVLGDRIAIMSEGELKCYGTSFFLKKKFGSGYHLICAKREGCNVNLVTALLRQYIPGISPESDVGTELSYRLSDSNSSIFEKMFSALENKADTLNLSGYGISITSLEEVFMKVGTENPYENGNASHGVIANSNVDLELTHPGEIFSSITLQHRGKDLYLNQFHALLLKKLIYTWRQKLFFLAITLIPLLLVLPDLISEPAVSQFFISAQPAMLVDLTQYPEAVIVLETNSLTPDSLESTIAEQYKLIVTSFGAKYMFESTGSNGFTQFILDLGKTMQDRINSLYLAAATVTPGKITAWLNNQPLHTAPLTLNLVHNAMARSLINPSAEIKVTNAPISSTSTKYKSTVYLGSSLYLVACSISSFYIIFVIKERTSRSKLLQIISGVNVWIFWLTQLIWDFATYAIVVTIMILLCHINKVYTFGELGCYFVLLLLFGWYILPFIYLISYLFAGPSMGFICILLMGIFTGFIIVCEMLSFSSISTGGMPFLSCMALRLLPSYPLFAGIRNTDKFVEMRIICSDPSITTLPAERRCELIPNCCSTVSYFDWEDPGLLRYIIYMISTGILCFLLVVFRDHGILRKLVSLKVFNRNVPPGSSHADHKDDDVLQEEERIAAMSSEEIAGQSLVLNKVSKYYGRFLAVNQISLCVRRKECFGLLGVNGAGKTTILKMMTGDEPIKLGSTYIAGMNLAKNRNKIYKEIAYCPQFDALLDDFTGRETLKIYCLLAGIRRNRIRQLIEELAKSLGFFKHLDKRCHAYSGGNKRKLSAAIAILGNPSVVFLDEPTTGLDPSARRQLWNIICLIRDRGKSIVLTSHNMEECEALCTRLTIMVNGELKCIGSIQHLKNKFSKGFVMKIKVNYDADMSNPIEMEQESTVNQDTQNVKQFVEQQFPKAILQEEYLGLLTYYIPFGDLKWSQIFGLLERNRASLKILDYSIRQTTLEDIFLEFAKAQPSLRQQIDMDEMMFLKTLFATVFHFITSWI